MKSHCSDGREDGGRWAGRVEAGAGEVSWEKGQVSQDGWPRDAAPEKWPREMKFRRVCRLSDVWSKKDGKSTRI